MNQLDPINSLAMSLMSAVYRDLEPIHYVSCSPAEHRAGKRGTDRTRRPDPTDCECVMFPQMWSSTALGFGGMGGASITTADTVIVFGEHRSNACVYFGGRFAYLVKPTEVFIDDMRKHQMADSATAKDRYQTLSVHAQAQ